MSYNINILNESNFKTSNWSGGKTTELAIYPSNAIYKNLNFKWRVSSATVDVEESSFTSLPNITRFITPLNGVLKLNHNSTELISLNPFEIHQFNGSDETKSFGKVRDFNLMLGENVQGSLSKISLDLNTTYVNLKPLETRNHSKKIFELFFSPYGDIEFAIENTKKVILHENELLLIHIDYPCNDFNISLFRTKKDCNILRATILL